MRLPQPSFDTKQEAALCCRVFNMVSDSGTWAVVPGPEDDFVVMALAEASEMMIPAEITYPDDSKEELDLDCADLTHDELMLEANQFILYCDRCHMPTTTQWCPRCGVQLDQCEVCKGVGYHKDGCSQLAYDERAQ